MVHVGSSRSSAYLEDPTWVHFFKCQSDTAHKYFSHKPKQEANNQATVNIMQKFIFNQHPFRKHETYKQVFILKQSKDIFLKEKGCKQ